jgi:hypothetical protein
MKQEARMTQAGATATPEVSCAGDLHTREEG